MTSAAIHLYQTLIGAVTWDDSREIDYFEYEPGFLTSGIEVSPLMMPLRAGRFSFPNIPRETFNPNSEVERKTMRKWPALLPDGFPTSRPTCVSILKSEDSPGSPKFKMRGHGTYFASLRARST